MSQVTLGGNPIDVAGRFPQAGEPASLELSAKVIKGEMKWP